VVQAQPVDGEVGRSVVAEDDHQMERVAEGESERSGELADYSGAGNLVGFGECELFKEGRLAGANLLRRVEKNAHLNHGGGFDRLVRIERSGLAGF